MTSIADKNCQKTSNIKEIFDLIKGFYENPMTLNLMVKDWMIYFLDEEQQEKMSAVTTKKQNISLPLKCFLSQNIAERK